MIQRIQSIFIFFSALLSFIAGAFGYVNAQSLSIFGVSAREELIFVSFFCGILLIISLLYFKKRTVQIKLNKFVILLNTVLIALFLYYLLTVSGESFDSEKGILVFLFFLVVVLLVFANQYITKDERLVKSVDRIR